IAQRSEKQFEINQVLVEVDLLPYAEGLFHAIYQNKSYQIAILKADFETKTFSLKINQKTVQIEAKDKFDLLLEKMGMNAGAKAKVNHLKAPMPGAILDIKVHEGQAIKKGEPLIILEAMKMENVLKAPADALVKTIMVNLKENVEKNQVLIVFE
ncbi:MAG: acetyl-CoA carboxylase biotin carboxyl carrier protein subunit, partial [Microscillaceae bacterium]|nr:acetyl-CoA carboxylase biotin carboxyl carrier protein subunit [Microscillaceae bacterium]MDW8459705.1 acetyl-CoA carboxylase biotin carboxyl carrier protein subunit [Cytophagales bacterium]